jgi:carbon storage regulator
MLVLSRQIGQEIVIAGSVRVRVVSVQGNKVRLAVDAPPEVTVDRQEVHERRNSFRNPHAAPLEEDLSAVYP